jgi:hypothetical protein
MGTRHVAGRRGATVGRRGATARSRRTVVVVIAMGAFAAGALAGAGGAFGIAATGPPTNPLCVYTPTDFAHAFLNALGEPQTDQNVEAILAWETAEGGNWHNTAMFNPLNTTFRYDGSSNFNGGSASGVQAFRNWDDGVYATALTLTDSFKAPDSWTAMVGYDQISAALAAGSNALAVTNAVDASEWGTRNASAFLGQPYNPPAPSWDVPCIGVSSVFVEGPANSMTDYWSNGGPWSSASLAGSNSTYGAPGVAAKADGSLVMAVQGPNDALWVYWETASGVWQGPLGVGAAGTALSAPSVVFGSTGLPVVAVEGPGGQLWVYWEKPGGVWDGPLGVGSGGSTFGQPAMLSGSTGLPVIAVEGPASGLWVYWETPGGVWVGPLGVGASGSTAAPPAMAAGSTGLPVLATRNAASGLWVYWEKPGGVWDGPLGVGASGSTLSAPTVAVGPTNLPMLAAEGPGNGLWVYWQGPGGLWQGPLGVGASGSTFGTPAMSVGTTGLPALAVLGPGGALWDYWQSPGGQWQGPLGLGGPGAALSPPAVARPPSS